MRGGEVNTERCAVMLVDEFRACKWGRISLERPPQRDDMADFAEMNEVYAEFFQAPFPARSAFAVKTLPKNARVEIELIAEAK